MTANSASGFLRGPLANIWAWDAVQKGRQSRSVLPPVQKELFAAVIKSLQQLDNPQRANNFATGLRELSTIILADLAPDADIKACSWFKPEIPNGSPTRSQRVRYAVQAGLMDDFVRNTLKVDVDKTIKRFTKLIERLSSLTHITENTFGMSKTAAKKFVNESLDVFIALFQTIDECHDNTLERLITAANHAITDELISYSVVVLEEIATHYTLDGSGIENLEIAKMDSTTLIFDAEGFVDCVLQYGCDGDVERRDGMRHDDSYPLQCKLVADITTPLTFEVHNLHVDNSSFYE